MQTIMIDGSMYASPKELHLALKHLLSLPDYYGLNADALNDCLAERSDPVCLWIYNPGDGDTAAALNIISRVISDNGGSVRGMVTAE